MLSFKSFVLSCPAFRSLIHFEVIFVYGVRECSNFIILHIAIFSQHRLLKILCFLHCMCLPPLHRLIDHRCMGLFLPFLSCSIDLYFCFCANTILFFITVALLYSLRLGSLIFPALFFFLRIALSILGLLCLHANVKHFSFSCMKHATGNLTETALNL